MVVKIRRGIARKALAAAKKLEKIPLPSAGEIRKEHSKDSAEIRQLQRLLKPEWFVKDIDRPRKRRK
jgi:hypothetical protein